MRFALGLPIAALVTLAIFVGLGELMVRGIYEPPFRARVIEVEVASGEFAIFIPPPIDYVCRCAQPKPDRPGRVESARATLPEYDCLPGAASMRPIAPGSIERATFLRNVARRAPMAAAW